MASVQVIEAPLVERGRELEALGRVLEAARRGEGAAAVVEGPPGIGKSRLLAAVAASADDLEVVRARASELERDFPWAVVRQLFEPVLFAAADADERERLLAGAGALAERVFVASAADDPGVDIYANLHGLYWFAANLAASRPVLLLVDDAQWSDAASLRWLAFLVHRLEGMPLALVLAVRTGEAGAEPALLDEVVSDNSVLVISPAVLSDAGIARLVDVALGHPPDAEFLTACQQTTAGNPFLVRELLRELAERGVTAAAENAPVVERLSPSGVGRAVRARLRRLPPGCLELARAVSVLGDGCELPVAARLAKLDEPAAARAVDALAAASVLEPSRPLAFVHPLVRVSVYEELGAAERSAMHARAGRVLAEAHVDVDRIAVQLLATAPQGDRRVVKLLREAAESARRRGATDAEVTHLRRALSEPPSPELVGPLVFELGSAELQAGEIEGAVEHLSRALAETADAPRRAAVALVLANGLLFTDRAPDAVDVLSDAIDGLAGGEAELAAHLTAMRAIAGRSSLDAYRRLPAETHTPVRAASAPRTIGERLQLGQQAVNEVLRGTASQARSLALQALGDGELLEATGAHYQPLYFALNGLIGAHAFDDAERHLEAVLRDARRRGSEGGFVAASNARAGLWWRRGALAELEADARAALDREAAPYGLQWAALTLADALLERGDAEAASAQLHAVGLDRETPAPYSGVLALMTRAHIRLAQRRPDDALVLLLECGRVEDDFHVVNPAFTSWRAEAAVVLARLGKREQAFRLAAEAVRRADAFGSPVARGIALRAAALVEQPPDHDGLAASVASLQDSGARLELARSLVELGAALRRSGRRGDARDALREGLELAVDCGADALAVRAHDELVAAGARPRRDPIESRSTLTASELRVARMAADGLTNREIAQALFLTEKTIEVHLTRAYRKLEIHSRSQLARALPAAAPS
jgi:DNA-binding CsgD family transcriptional regulator/predicted negative regulator of RcsB-dependent stress response